MKTHASTGDAVAWPFLVPGTPACRAIGRSRHRDLVRILIDSPFRTVLGVLVVVAVA